MTARGSEHFTWKLYPGVPHVCASCGHDLRVADVGRVHTSYDYASGLGRASTVFFCIEDIHEGYGATDVLMRQPETFFLLGRGADDRAIKKSPPDLRRIERE